MRTGRLAAYFILRLAVIFGLLAVPWPGLRGGYAAAFAKCADALTHGVWDESGMFGSDGYARVYAQPIDESGHDLKIIVARKVESQGRIKYPGPEPFKVGSRQLGYLPAAAVAALVLATPIGWVRRLFALAVGELLVHAFIVARSAMILLYAFCGDAPYSLFNPTGIGRRSLEIGYDLLAVEPVAAYVVPIFVWIAVTIRRRDVVRWTTPPLSQD